MRLSDLLRRWDRWSGWNLSRSDYLPFNEDTPTDDTILWFLTEDPVDAPDREQQHDRADAEVS